MSAAATTEFVDICEQPGARLDLNLCRFDPDLAPTNIHLLTLLAVTCGAGESVGYAFVERGTPDGWLRLREVDAPGLEKVVRRIRRQYPEFQLHGGEAVGVHRQLTVHFNTAQARRRREP